MDIHTLNLLAFVGLGILCIHSLYYRVFHGYTDISLFGIILLATSSIFNLIVYLGIL